MGGFRNNGNAVGVFQNRGRAVNGDVGRIHHFQVERKGAFDGAEVAGRSVELDARISRSRGQRNIKSGIDQSGGGVVVEDPDVFAVINVRSREISDREIRRRRSVQSPFQISYGFNSFESSGSALVRLREEAAELVGEHHVHQSVGGVQEPDGVPVFKGSPAGFHGAVPGNIPGIVHGSGSRHFVEHDGVEQFQSGRRHARNQRLRRGGGEDIEFAFINSSGVVAGERNSGTAERRTSGRHLAGYKGRGSVQFQLAGKVNGFGSGFHKSGGSGGAADVELADDRESSGGRVGGGASAVGGFGEFGDLLKGDGVGLGCSHRDRA